MKRGDNHDIQRATLRNENVRCVIYPRAQRRDCSDCKRDVRATAPFESFEW